MSNTHIRRAQVTEHAALVELWERAVRATHAFLAEADIVHLRPLVAEYFASATTDLWVLTDQANVPVGVLGLAGDSIAALFMDPVHREQGGGRRLVSHAQELCGGDLTVDVNEQNVTARGFYEALGFAVVGRSPVDDMGRPFSDPAHAPGDTTAGRRWLTAEYFAIAVGHLSRATPTSTDARVSSRSSQIWMCHSCLRTLTLWPSASPEAIARRRHTIRPMVSSVLAMDERL